MKNFCLRALIYRRTRTEKRNIFCGWKLIYNSAEPKPSELVLYPPVNSNYVCLGA